MKFYKLIILGGVLISVIFITLILQKESEHARRQRLYYFSILKLKRIGVALLEYSEKEGNGKTFPPSLNLLVTKGYLKKKESISGLHYMKNTCRGMPVSIPLLIETGTSHIIRGRKGTLILNSRFSITYIVNQDTSPKKYIETTKMLLKKIDKASNRDLLELLERSRDFVTISLTLWKMEQRKFYSPEVNTFFNSESEIIDRYTDQILQYYAARVLYQFDKKLAKQKLLLNLPSNNYFKRKFIWKKLYPQKASIEYVSKKICHKIMVQNLQHRK